MMSMELQLVEALCGFKRPVQTLDNRTLFVTSHPGTSAQNAAIVGLLKTNSSPLLIYCQSSFNHDLAVFNQKNSRFLGRSFYRVAVVHLKPGLSCRFVWIPQRINEKHFLTSF